MSNETTAETDENKGLDFIRTIVADDLRANRHHGNVTTRFPPEPNGYLHLGHAKSICLNFGIANENAKGKCHLRFDDTNPITEDTEYIESIQNDVMWLGFDWGNNLYFASDYFPKFYALAQKLVEVGKAYVCDLSEDKIREYRGTVTQSGKPSPFRNRSVKENLKLLEKMKRGEFSDGDCVLRAKIDMAAANMKMRDPLIYRIRKAHHHRTGETWCIYPMYDFAHCLSDSIEGITHSICTLEFENNRELYDWFLDATEMECHPQQIEFARLSVTFTIMSKRKLLRLVQEGIVNGWDDPRMPTIAGMRRRGYTPEGIRDFCHRIGVAKANSTVDISLLEHCMRIDLNHRCPRVMAVINPLKLVITNYPEDQVEELDASYWPHDVPKEGNRKIPFSQTLYIERDDFRENPSKDFFRLSPGKEVRLRYAYVLRCDKVIKNDVGEIIELRCSYDADTLGESPKGRKVKGTIHWLSAHHALKAQVRMYDRLFTVERPDAEEGDFKDFLNPNSLRVVENALVEPSLGNANPGDRFQFERQGYFSADCIEFGSDTLVFNRTVPLKDSWAKHKSPSLETKSTKAPNPPKKTKDSTETRKRKKSGKADERATARTNNPELQSAFNTFQKSYRLSEYDSDILSGSTSLISFFQHAIVVHNNPKLVANWIVNELLREIKDQPVEELRFGGDKLGELISLIDNETISGKIAKSVFAELLATGRSPKDIVADKGLEQISNPQQLQEVIDSVLSAHQSMVQEYKAGQKSRFGFFVGQVMKATGGKANPKVVNELLNKSLS